MLDIEGADSKTVTLALNLGEEIGAVLMGNETKHKTQHKARLSDRVLEVPVGLNRWPRGRPYWVAVR